MKNLSTETLVHDPAKAEAFYRFLKEGSDKTQVEDNQESVEGELEDPDDDEPPDTEPAPDALSPAVAKRVAETRDGMLREFFSHKPSPRKETMPSPSARTVKEAALQALGRYR